jgi:hypothetical protein
MVPTAARIAPAAATQSGTVPTELSREHIPGLKSDTDRSYIRSEMTQRERQVLERAVQAMAKQARDAYDLVDALTALGLPAEEGPVLAARR